jgi:hypothetical protein
MKRRSVISTCWIFASTPTSLRIQYQIRHKNAAQGDEIIYMFGICVVPKNFQLALSSNMLIYCIDTFFQTNAMFITFIGKGQVLSHWNWGAPSAPGNRAREPHALCEGCCPVLAEQDPSVQEGRK